MTQGKPLVCLVVLLLVLSTAPAWASVYASGLTQTGMNAFSYILNENADVNVQAQVWQVGGGMVYSQDLGAQAKGTQNWTWNGSGGVIGNSYKIKIVAADDGYAAWTKISTDNSLNNFYSSRGVAVNANQSSQYFGRTYVSEQVGGLTGAGRTTQDGLYLLNADGSDAVGQGDTAKNGGVAWVGASSPWRVLVGPDSNVYVCDWSDAHSGLWMGDGDFNAASEVLDSTGRATSGLNVTHGSISGFLVEGTGAARTIYTIDEDLPLAPTAQRGSIWRYDIGTNALFTGAPSGILYDDGVANKVQNYYNDIVHANDGTWWITEDRSGGTADTLMSLLQISADGSTILWSSIPALASFSINDPLRRTRALAYDPVHNYLALATYNAGQVLIFDPTTKTIVSSFTMGSTATNRDVAFDAAGNLYVVDNTTERMAVWSPGTGANSFTTESWFEFQPVPEPSSMLALLIGVPGLFVYRRRRH